MGRFSRTVFWGALACVIALLLLVVWWNGGEKDKAAGKREAAGSAPASESRRSLGEWMRPWGFFAGSGRESQAEKAWEPKDVEEAVRRTFLAYNRQDIQTFKAGWTDKGFQQAYERPKEKVKHFGLLGLLSFRPYTIGEFSNTALYGKSAVTEVELTYGEVQESHRMSLVWEEDAWKIDQDEKLELIPKDATVVDVKLYYFNIQLDRTQAAPGTVAFRITNTDTRQHEFIVKKMNASSDTEDNVGLIKPLDPGKNETLILKLAPGRYVLLCNLVVRDGTPYSYGMRAEFTVQ